MAPTTPKLNPYRMLCFASFLIYEFDYSFCPLFEDGVSQILISSTYWCGGTLFLFAGYPSNTIPNHRDVKQPAKLANTTFQRQRSPTTRNAILEGDEDHGC